MNMIKTYTKWVFRCRRCLDIVEETGESTLPYVHKRQDPVSLEPQDELAAPNKCDYYNQLHLRRFVYESYE